MNKEKIEKAIQKIESRTGWNYINPGRHYGYRGYWFVDGECCIHWVSTWEVRKVAKEEK